MEDYSNRGTFYIATVASCSVSAFWLISTILGFIFISKSRANVKLRSASLIVNLAIALLLFNILLILRCQEFVSSGAACLIIEMLEYLFALSAICWVLVEGINIYLAIAHKFYTRAQVTDGTAILYSFLWAWLTPFVYLMIVLAVKSFSYENKLNTCIDDIDLIFGVIVVPCSVVLCLTAVCYLIVTYKAVCSRVSRFSRTYKTTELQLNVLFSWIVFVFVCGSFVFKFGIIKIQTTDPNILEIFTYVFAVCNSLQGFSVFLLYMVRQGVATQTYAKVIPSKSNRNNSRLNSQVDGVSRRNGQHRAKSIQHNRRRRLSSKIILRSLFQTLLVQTRNADDASNNNTDLYSLSNIDVDLKDNIVKTDEQKPRMYANSAYIDEDIYYQINHDEHSLNELNDNGSSSRSSSRSSLKIEHGFLFIDKSIPETRDNFENATTVVPIYAKVKKIAKAESLRSASSDQSTDTLNSLYNQFQIGTSTEFKIRRPSVVFSNGEFSKF